MKRTEEWTDARRHAFGEAVAGLMDAVDHGEQMAADAGIDPEEVESTLTITETATGVRWRISVKKEQDDDA